MHQTRARASSKLPIPRKGTRYLVRTKDHPEISVPTLIAIRDMLHLAQTLREVKHLIHTKKLKVNGRAITDYRQPIKILSLLEADKKYKLVFLTTGKFSLEASNDTTRIAKVVGKRMVTDNKIQISLHDGTSLLTTKKIAVGDSVVLTMDNEIKEVKPMAKGAKVMAISGRSIGNHGVVHGTEGEKVRVTLGGREVALERSHVIVL